MLAAVASTRFIVPGAGDDPQAEARRPSPADAPAAGGARGRSSGPSLAAACAARLPAGGAAAARRSARRPAGSASRGADLVVRAGRHMRARRRQRVARRRRPRRRRPARDAHARGHDDDRPVLGAATATATAVGARCGCRCSRTARPAGCRARRSAAITVVAHAPRRRPRRAQRRRSCAAAARPPRAGRRSAGRRWPTPTGEFFIRNKLTRYASPHLRPGRVRHERPLGRPHRLARGGYIGIHGTDQPELLPGARLARLHPAAQRRHPASRPADARRHAGHDPLRRRPYHPAFRRYHRAMRARLAG